MIVEEIKINGTLYKLQNTVYSNMDYCILCDLYKFCNANKGIMIICNNNAKKSYYIRYKN